MSTDDERADSLRRAGARSEELRATHRRLALRHAEVEERGAEVHDQAARVHEELGDRSLLDPAELSAHAQRGRDRAALERRRAAGEPQPPLDDAAAAPGDG